MSVYMSEARQLPDFTVVDAEILKQRVLDDNDPLTQEAVTRSEYICYHCDAKVKPIAIGLYNPQTNNLYRKPPHFSLIKDELHTGNNCPTPKKTNNSEIDPTHKYLEKSPIETYPNRLSLDRLNLSNDKKSEPRDRVSIAHNKLSDSDNSDTRTAWTASSISPLVKHFLEPENRYLPLYIHDVNVNTYNRVFERIYFLENHNQDRLRIYFAQIIYTKISRINNQYTFFLTDGRFGKDKFTPTTMSTLVIDTSNWSSEDVEYLNKKIAEFKDKAKSLTKRKELKRGGSLPWIFFLGFASSENDLSRLLCNDLRLIELCITEKLNDISEIPPLDLQSSYNSDKPNPNKLILKKKNDKVNPDSTELSSQSTDIKDVNKSSLNEYKATQASNDVEMLVRHHDVSIFDHQTQTYSEPENTHESKSSQPDEDLLGQIHRRRRNDAYQRIDSALNNETRKIGARAKQQKRRRVLKEKAWKAVKDFTKPFIEKLMNFFRNL